MKRRRFLTLLDGIVLVLIFTLIIFSMVALAASASASEKHVWKFQSIYGPTGDATVLGAWRWADNVEKATGGRIAFEKYPAHQLVPISKSLDALEQGTIDVLFSAGGYYIGTVPYSDFFMLPCPFAECFQRVYDFYWNTDVHKLIRKWYMEDKGVYHVMPISFSGQITFTIKGKSIKKLEDYKGKKLQCSGGTISHIVQKLGAVPVTGIASAEIYTALQRGTIDASSWVCYSFESYKFKEVCGGVTVPGLAKPVNVDIWISGKAWDKLTDELKAKIEEVSKGHAEFVASFGMEEYDVKVPAWCKQFNMEYNVLSKADQEQQNKIFQSTWPDFGKRNPRNAELLKILRDYLSKNPLKEPKRTW
jgi:TRAP-type C4-dicarboxylate transport system substrate-binding protein